tara:strand:+ start:75 stop:242 length:168 start_codon:yes stop_codon:yes gene_type:complete
MTDILREEFQLLNAEVAEQETDIENLEDTKIKLETQINLMKLILVEQMEKFHANV